MSENGNPDLRFQRVETWLIEKVSNIAQNKGMTISDFLKPHIREIVSKYPAILKGECLDTESKPLRVYGVAKNVDKEFNAIVENFGGNPSYFFKIHLFSILEQYPEHLKLPPKDF